MYNTDDPIRIAIIGGGFCGILTAIHLLQDPEQHLHIHIFNSGKPIGCGVAYDPHTPGLLLNVPNGNMSAFPDKPRHFLQWLMEKEGITESEADKLAAGFSPRSVYGQYLSQLWRDELDKQGYNKRIFVYNDLVTDIVENDRRVLICTAKYPRVMADIAIIATGNDQPAFPSGLHPSLKTHQAYFGDPWKRDCLQNLQSGGDVLVIGNGLTMVDTVLGLAANGCSGVIHSVSPHGYRLKPWKDAREPYCTEADILDNTSHLADLVSVINKHRKLADKFGQSIYPVIDSLRPKIQSLWLSFSMDEKQQFLKKLSAFWDRVRHRLPTVMHQLIEDMRSANKVVTHKGAIISAVPAADGFEVTIAGDDRYVRLRVQRIINCTGPEANITRSGNQLLQNLLKKGVICPGPFNLGINTDPDGCVISADGRRKPNLYVAGGNLKGILWESTAVPELRHQAKKIALYILQELKQSLVSID
jgi:uncharacterized NAD(P)/FAD-binding protein YdhS